MLDELLESHLVFEPIMGVGGESSPTPFFGAVVSVGSDSNHCNNWYDHRVPSHNFTKKTTHGESNLFL